MFKAGLIYFAIVFGGGFVLGMARITLLVPRVGIRAAELIESPVMLLAIVMVARFVRCRFNESGQTGKLLGAGLIAVGLLLAAELFVGVILRGKSAVKAFPDRDPVSGAVYYGLLGVFATLPWLLAVFRDGLK